MSDQVEDYLNAKYADSIKTLTDRTDHGYDFGFTLSAGAAQDSDVIGTIPGAGVFSIESQPGTAYAIDSVTGELSVATASELTAGTDVLVISSVLDHDTRTQVITVTVTA